MKTLSKEINRAGKKLFMEVDKWQNCQLSSTPRLKIVSEDLRDSKTLGEYHITHIYNATVGRTGFFSISKETHLGHKHPIEDFTTWVETAYELRNYTVENSLGVAEGIPPTISVRMNLRDLHSQSGELSSHQAGLRLDKNENLIYVNGQYQIGPAPNGKVVILRGRLGKVQFNIPSAEEALKRIFNRQTVIEVVFDEFKHTSEPKPPSFLALGHQSHKLETFSNWRASVLFSHLP